MDHWHNIYGAPNLLPDQQREIEAVQRMKNSQVLLDAGRRTIVEQSIRAVCDYRNWLLSAIHVRTNHVHKVVTAGIMPEKVMQDFKSYATREMTEKGLWTKGEKCWSRHGSTIYLWTPKSIDCACDYVINGQGDDLPKFEEWK